MGPVRSFRWLVLISAIAGVQGGCLGWFEGGSQTIGYVLKKGDSEAIAKWTLRQNSGRKIWDGITALNYRVVQSRDSTAELAFSIHWYCGVVSELEKYPKDYVFQSSDGNAASSETAEVLVEYAFVSAASASFNHPTCEALLTTLRPDANHSQWLPEWEEAVAKLAEWRQEKRSAVRTPQN